jgi:hypothetical protein
MKLSVGIALRVFPIWFLIGGAAASAQNLLTNPGFNTDVSGWTPIAADITAIWNSEDASGSPSSGSASITETTASAGSADGVASPCIPVTAGGTYSFGARFKIPASQTSEPKAATAVTWYSGAGCSGSQNTTSAPFQTTVGSWFTSSLSNVIAPAGAAGALFSLYAGAGLAGTANVLADDAYFIREDNSCIADDKTLCLNGGRFKVRARWESHDSSGDGTAVGLTGDTGYFWFFTANNIEVVAKVVGACIDPFNRYWVFASGLTNVRVTLTVIDTNNGSLKTYVNPLDTAFAPIQDTDAFATCP